MKRFVLSSIICLQITACVTNTDLNKSPTEPPPTISEDMSTDDAVDAALKFGGDTLAKVKALLKKRKEADSVAKSMEEQLSKSGVEDIPENRLMNMMHLLQFADRKPSLDLFRSLINRERQSARDLGWNIAANYPSRAMAQAMDSELSKMVSQGEEEKFMVPQMAVAVQKNKLKSVYTLLRLALMEKGNDEFARAMIDLSPQTAGDDFFPYLAKASIEELRQINQTTVNVYTCMVILKHFASTPASIANPLFPQLFLYAVSRNPSLSELASMAIDALLPSYKADVALMLAQQPAWIQIAFVEGMKRRRSTYSSTFLAELKQATTHDEVDEEINEGDGSGTTE